MIEFWILVSSFNISISTVLPSKEVFFKGQISFYKAQMTMEQICDARELGHIWKKDNTLISYSNSYSSTEAEYCTICYKKRRIRRWTTEHEEITGEGK